MRKIAGTLRDRRDNLHLALPRSEWVSARRYLGAGMVRDKRSGAAFFILEIEV